jgi:hypothetical protein
MAPKYSDEDYDRLMKDRNRLFSALFVITAHPEDADRIASEAMMGGMPLGRADE